VPRKVAQVEAEKEMLREKLADAENPTRKNKVQKVGSACYPRATMRLSVALRRVMPERSAT
jgi:hypothetical protein